MGTIHHWIKIKSRGSRWIGDGLACVRGSLGGAPQESRMAQVHSEQNSGLMHSGFGLRHLLHGLPTCTSA